MKKNLLGVGLLALGSFALTGFALIGAKQADMLCAEPEEEVLAEEEKIEEVEEVFECSIVVESIEHGSLKFSANEGHAGDVIVVTTTPDWFYIMDSITVNGTSLIESESVSGEYSFVLVEGENKVAAKFIVNEELLGAFAHMYDQAMNKDWTSLFSLANVLTLVKWVIDSGVLIIVIRYFIKDKKLADKVERTVKKSVNEIVPQLTKDTVVKTVEEVIKPIFVENTAQIAELMQGMNVFSKVLALMQENTPESRVAILDALSHLALADMSSIAQVQEYIKELVQKQQETYNDVMARLDKIEESKKANIVEEEQEMPKVEEEKPVEEKSVDNGTQI